MFRVAVSRAFKLNGDQIAGIGLEPWAGGDKNDSSIQECFDLMDKYHMLEISRPIQ